MSHPLLNIAITAARKAGNLIVRATDRLDTIKVATKESARDLVTEIDQTVEQEIIQIIRKSYPHHGIIAEESGTHQATRYDDYCWIIDPLDGTTNFVHGIPHFAVSIAVSYKGKIEHGVIYDPVRQELFTTTRGEGARLNQYRIRVSNRTVLSQALLATSFPTHFPLAVYLRSFVMLMQQAGGIRRTGSAALDLAYVAAGRLDGLWQYGLKKWDIAAGALLVKEAGGLIAEPNGDHNFLTSGDIVAANPKILDQLIAILKEDNLAAN